MPKLPKKLQHRLTQRAQEGTLRTLTRYENLVDFTSNDYLGVATKNWEATSQNRGSGGSRLLSGNHPYYEQAEIQIARYHQAESALIFNSGYDANIGLLSALLQRNDLIFYDSLVHASIRDGIALGKARSYRFAHNDLSDLQKTINRVWQPQKDNTTAVYVITESVYSMDGDGPDLKTLAEYCTSEGFHLIVDEAHATGILGSRGSGGVVAAGIESQVFARVITFGKALGCHGAAILGRMDLREYLINFSRSLIYTTALSPDSLQAIMQSYEWLASEQGESARKRLIQLIYEFKRAVKEMGLQNYFGPSIAAVQAYIPGSVSAVKIRAQVLRDAGYDIRPILRPTVPEGKECLRISLHSFNTEVQIRNVLHILASYHNT